MTKRVYFNETSNLLPSIRERFLHGEQRYDDQEHPLEFESARTQEIMSGQLKYQGGYRLGRMPRRDPKDNPLPEKEQEIEG